MPGTRSNCSSDKLENVKNEILHEFQVFRNKYEKDINELKSSLEDLKSQNTTLKNKIKDKDNIIVDLEKAVAEHQQYTRRNNIEIVGIPETVTQESLEEKVIQLAGALNVPLKSSDIEACHRLFKSKKSKNPQQPKVTIVRFVNRKHAELLHRKKKNFKKVSLTDIGLSKHKIYINNNLCPFYSIIMGKASQLFREKKIFKYWSYNGVVNIMESDGQRPRKILHVLDIDHLFDDHLESANDEFSSESVADFSSAL